MTRIIPDWPLARSRPGDLGQRAGPNFRDRRHRTHARTHVHAPTHTHTRKHTRVCLLTHARTRARLLAHARLRARTHAHTPRISGAARRTERAQKALPSLAHAHPTPLAAQSDPTGVPTGSSAGFSPDSLPGRPASQGVDNMLSCCMWTCCCRALLAAQSDPRCYRLHAWPGGGQAAGRPRPRPGWPGPCSPLPELAAAGPR